MTQDDHKPDYVIRKRRSSNWYWAISLSILLALGAAAAFGYWLNQKRYDFSETAEQQFNQVQESLKEANSSAVRWQQQYELEKNINQELRKHTFDLEQQLHNRKKEVEAFQRIFDPDSVESGLQIANFSWEQVAAKEYSYRLILSQAKKQQLAINGSYDLILLGHLDKAATEINFNELESLTEKERKFRFQYLEVRNGRFKLPDYFTPQSVRVVVKSTGRNGKTISQDYPWNPQAEINTAKDTNNKEEQTSDNPNPSGG